MTRFDMTREELAGVLVAIAGSLASVGAAMGIAIALVAMTS